MVHLTMVQIDAIGQSIKYQSQLDQLAVMGGGKQTSSIEVSIYFLLSLSESGINPYVLNVVFDIF